MGLEEGAAALQALHRLRHHAPVVHKGVEGAGNDIHLSGHIVELHKRLQGLGIVQQGVQVTAAHIDRGHSEGQVVEEGGVIGVLLVFGGGIC